MVHQYNNEAGPYSFLLYIIKTVYLCIPLQTVSEITVSSFTSLTPVPPSMQESGEKYEVTESECAGPKVTVHSPTLASDSNTET